MGVRVLILTLVTAITASAADSRAMAILKKAEETHQHLGAFEFRASQIDEVPAAGKTKTTEDTVSTIARSKTEFRTESDSGGLIHISNGRTTWEYIPDRRQFTRRDEASQESYFSRFAHISQNVEEATLLPEQELGLEGERVACYVVRAELSPRPDRVETTMMTYWIDKARWLVLREIFERHVTKSPFNEPLELRSTVTLTRARLNPPLADSLFEFSAPVGAHEVDEFLPGRDLTGEMAPDFTLKDLRGGEFRLSSTRGKVVLLDFWATWCPPCREAMPVLQKLFMEYKDKGLLVVSMNVNDPIGKARDFADKAGITYPVVLAEGGPAVEQFQAHGLPVMMIIDREGKVIGHYGGWTGEAKLRERLSQAGIR